jgi:fructose-specific phosphotransferase system IIC component
MYVAAIIAGATVTAIAINFLKARKPAAPIP